MRILHLETGRHLYGGAKQLQYLLSGLASYPDVQNELVCPQGSAIGKECANIADKCHPVPFKGELDVGFLFRLLRLFRARSPDIVHVHSRRGADIWGGLAARMCGIKSVISRRVDNPEARGIVKYKYGMYDRVITISQGIRDVLLKEGVPEEKIHCVPSAVDWENYQQDCDRTWFEQEFDLPDFARPVAMIAQFISRKGHDCLIRAMPSILRECPEARFLLLGTGGLYHSCRDRIREMGMEYAVRMPGFRDDLEKILSCLDLVVHPAQMEGLGVSLLQACAAGVPVVATPVGGIPEIVVQDENGYLVPVQDSERLAAAVVELLKDEPKRQEFARAGRSRVREKFDIQSMVKGNYRVYQELI